MATKDNFSSVSSADAVPKPIRKRKYWWDKKPDDAATPNIEESESGAVDNALVESKSTKNTPIGDSNDCDDSGKCASKSREKNSEENVSPKSTKGGVDINDPVSESAGLPNENSDTVSTIMNRRKTWITLQVTMNLNR